MNVLIVDTDKISVDRCHQICKDCMAKTTDDLVVIPNGIDIFTGHICRLDEDD